MFADKKNNMGYGGCQRSYAYDDFEDFLGEVTATVMWAQGASIKAAFKMAAQSRAIET